jgi:hypothetical protein
MFLILLLTCLSGLAWSAGIDVVVMVDISESMFPVFDDVVNYLLRDLLENRLHQGDSFHLLSFADSPEKEVQISIEETSDLTEVIDRIFLLKPLGQYTDLIAAVDFLYDYTRSIPEQNKKLILLLTDGIHDPPPGSPNRLESGDVLARLLESSEKIKHEGWDVHILRMPGEREPDDSTEELGTTGQDLLEELSEQLETDVLIYEEVEKESLTDQLTGLSRVDRRTLDWRILSWQTPLPYLMDAAFTRFFAGIAETRKGRRSIRPLIMKVDSQNPNIGTRNIHSVPPGARRSVGGDGSTFLIYYIQMPRRIGEIRNDGKQYRFVPKKSEYFQDLNKPLADCLGKQIRAVSTRGREVTFHFHEYVSPLEEINRLMRSVPKFHIGDVPLKGATPKAEKKG